MTTLEPGTVVAGKFRIERVLGEGGMGIVLAAHHLHLGRLVAIKLLKPDALAHPDIVARFANEARSASRIQSEHVARVLDVGALERTRNTRHVTGNRNTCCADAHARPFIGHGRRT